MKFTKETYVKAYNEANGQVIRLAQQLDAARNTIRLIGRLSEDPRIVEICKAAIAGQPIPDDTKRLDAVIEAEADVEKTLKDMWRVTGVDEYEDPDLRQAIDKLIAANPGVADVL